MTVIIVLLLVSLALMLLAIFYTVNLCKDMQHRIKRLYRYDDERYEYLLFRISTLEAKKQQTGDYYPRAKAKVASSNYSASSYSASSATHKHTATQRNGMDTRGEATETR